MGWYSDILYDNIRRLGPLLGGGGHFFVFFFLFFCEGVQKNEKKLSMKILWIFV